MNPKLKELQAQIAGVLTAFPIGQTKDAAYRLRVKALKACMWRLRGPNGEFVGLGPLMEGLKCRFVPEAQGLIFDGRDNEERKLKTYEAALGPLVVEIIPQIGGAA